MTKAAALYNFFSGFTIPAYEENTVYAMAEQGQAPAYPYLTYEVKTGFFDMENSLTINFTLWYRSTAWTAANAKSQEISAAIGRRGVMLPVDGGRLWLRRTDGQWGENNGDASDDMVKRLDHSVILNYYTNN